MPYPWKFPIMTLEDLIAYKRRFHQLKSSKQMTTLENYDRNMIEYFKGVFK